MQYIITYNTNIFCTGARFLTMKKKKWKNYQTFTTKNWL